MNGRPVHVSSVLECASGLSVETTPSTDKTQPISVSYSLHSMYSRSPSSSRTRTSTTALLSEPSNASPLFRDDKLAVLSKGVVVCISSVLLVMGLNEAHSMHACLWCKISANERYVYVYYTYTEKVYCQEKSRSLIEI